MSVDICQYSNSDPAESDENVKKEIWKYLKHGIKLSFIDSFINACGGRSKLVGLSTDDVNERHVKPMTRKMKVSYCEFLKKEYFDSVGEAQVFISHAWRCDFLNVIDTLQHHFRDNPDIIIWFDLFQIINTVPLI